MSYKFWQVVADTPWWVFIVFIYMMFAGYLATKPQVHHIRNFYLLLPVALIVSLFGMFLLINVTHENLIYYAISLVAATLFGWLACFRLRVRSITGNKMLLTHGTWAISVIVFALFSVKFYFNIQLSLDPALYRTHDYSLGIMIFYGAITGIAIGRIIFMQRALKHGPFISMEEVELIQQAH